MNEFRKLMETVKPLFEEKKRPSDDQINNYMKQLGILRNDIALSFNRFAKIDANQQKATLIDIRDRLQKFLVQPLDGVSGIYPDSPEWEIRVVNYPWSTLALGNNNQLSELVDSVDTKKILTSLKLLEKDLAQLAKVLLKNPDIRPFIEEETGTEVSKTVIGHTDDERDMIKKELYQMGTYCVELYKMIDSLPENADFPHWWQGKLVKAKEYISGVKHYLENELETSTEFNASERPEQQEPEPDYDPSGVSGL